MFRSLTSCSVLALWIAVPSTVWAQQPFGEVRDHRSSAGTVRRVPSDYPDIRSAVDASEDGDVVLLADGLYKSPGNRNVVIDGKSLTIESENGPESTEIVPAPGRAFFITATDESTVVEIRGVTIRNGNVRTSVPIPEPGRGGAVFVDEATLRIVDCVLESNVAQVGGAIAAGSAYLEVGDSEFRGNRAVPWQGVYAGGGAIFGTLSSLDVFGTVFADNAVNGFGDEGGAIVWNENPLAPLFEKTKLEMVDCVFSHNSVLADGGAMKLVALDEVSIDRCLFEGNSAGQGGGLTILGSFVSSESKATISNSLIVDNRATFNFGALSVFRMPTLTLRNCTISGNRITTSSPLTLDTTAGVFNIGLPSDVMIVESCILWDNAAVVPNPDVFKSQIGMTNVRAVIEFNDIQKNILPDNIGADPGFVDPEHGDHGLRFGSPAIDAGDPAFAPTPGELDFCGNPRVRGPRVDMGAIEWSRSFENQLVRNAADDKAAF